MKYYMNNSYALLQAGTECADCVICPQKLYLDITEDCNLWCAMCRDERSICGKTMTFDLFKKVVDETCPYVRSYSLFNWGEPLLVEDFYERVLYVNAKKRSDCTVEISTNGMLLNQRMIQFLAEQKVGVTISVDGATKETFEKIRRGGNFEHIMNNISEITKAYQAFPDYCSPSFYISIQKENQSQLLDIIKLAQSLGIRRVGFGLVMSPMELAPDQGDRLCWELEQVYQFLDDNDMFCDIYPTKVGNYLLVGNNYREQSTFLVSTTCNAPIVSAVVEYSGDVYLCCNVGEYVGNISNNSFLELWKSEAYARLRNQVNNPCSMPEKCKCCAWFNRN